MTITHTKEGNTMTTYTPDANEYAALGAAAKYAETQLMMISNEFDEATEHAPQAAREASDYILLKLDAVIADLRVLGYSAERKVTS